VAPGVSSVELKIFTVALRKIYDDPWLDVSPGQHLYSLDWNEIGGMANGFYYLVLTESSGGRQTRKIMKLLVQR